MKFRDFADYLLWSVYVRERAHPELSGVFFDLSESAAALDENVPSQWVFDAVRVLETRGLVRPILALGGYAGAALTGEGRLIVEDELTRPVGYIGRELATRPDLQQRLELLDGDGAAEPTPEEQRAPMFELLDELSLAAQQLSVTDEEKDDLAADIESMKLQLRKHQPNVDVVMGLLERMRRYRPLSQPAARMLELLYP
jgi:hypothetical protein